MISIDPDSVYHFGYLLFCSLPDLTTKVNSFDDLKKSRHFFIKSTADVTQIIHTLFTHLDTNEQCL